MSNTTSRTRGLAQRALALLMAMVLATTLTPSFALANEADATAGNAAEQGAAADAPNESSAATGAEAASKANAAASADKKAEASDVAASTAAKATSVNNASNAASSSASKSAGQTTSSSAPAAANEAKPATEDAGSKAETVTATLVIDTHIGAPISKSFTIEKGKTVEDLLNLAVNQGAITGYTHGKPSPGYTSYYINSITIGKTEYAPTSDTGFYWASTINGSWDTTGLNGTAINENGFSYELSYVTWMTPEATQYPVDKNAPHPDKASSNDTTAVIGGNGNTSTVSSAPTASGNAKLNWKKTYGGGNYSEILSIGDSVYFASSLYGANWNAQTAILHRLNSKGEETASLQLFGSIDSTCRMVYTDGIIVIPLSNGRLQGVSASEMKTMWVSDAIASGAQSVSTVAAANGMVFTGTANSLDSSYMATAGTFFGINAITGERVWANEETDTGFYWAGACKVGNVLLYGNDAGTLTAVDPATGKTVSTLKLSSAIRSTVIANNAGTAAYVTTNDGTMHKIAVSLDGALSEAGATAFGAKSTSTATLFEGNLFVGGGTVNWQGCLSVIDATTMQIKSTVKLPFEVKSTPLVAKAADGKTYAYFTCNGAEGDYPTYTSGGGAWVYCLETNTAAKLFDATGDAANYCTKSITMGADGTLYWTNDSGTLFALVNAIANGGENGSSNGNNDDNAQSGTSPGTNNGKSEGSGSNGGVNHAPSASPINTAKSSAAAQTPLSAENDDADGDASAEDETFGVEPASTSSAHNASTDNATEQQIPWLPITGIAVGCAGLIGVGVYLFRRRSL